jgi:uncharacterized RDD family membrane protein YckC
MSILGLSITETKPVLEGAGFWIRALARAIDYVWSLALGFLAGINAAIALAILEGLSIAGPGWEARIGERDLAIVVLNLLGYVAYQTLCEGLHGASLGKLICGLRVRAEDLAPCRLKPALIRSLAFYVDSLFFGVIGYLAMKTTPMEQRYGDRWAKTVVVKTARIPQDAPRPQLHFIYAFAIASAAWSLPMAAAIVWMGL